MQENPSYGDVVAEVADFLVARATAARDAGVQEVWIDPGIGFGKTADHNLSLLKHLGVLVETGFPVVVGTSRKRFLQRIIGADAGDVLEGSLATAVAAMAAGAGMVRVHDVRATVDAARVVGSAA
jgi:dihydropteroate synthase